MAALLVAQVLLVRGCSIVRGRQWLDAFRSNANTDDVRNPVRSADGNATYALGPESQKKFLRVVALA